MVKNNTLREFDSSAQSLLLSPKHSRFSASSHKHRAPIEIRRRRERRKGCVEKWGGQRWILHPVWDSTFATLLNFGLIRKGREREAGKGRQDHLSSTGLRIYAMLCYLPCLFLRVCTDPAPFFTTLESTSLRTRCLLVPNPSNGQDSREVGMPTKAPIDNHVD